MRALTGKKILVITPHMDDESLSCGGYLADQIEKGASVFVLVVFGRVYNYGRETVEESLSDEYKDCVDACDVLGVLKMSCLNLKEGEPYEHGYYRLLKEIEGAMDVLRPTEVIIPSNEDMNQDHRHLHDVCLIALRPANRGNVNRILKAVSFDSTAQPDVLLPLTQEAMDRKLRAIACYRRESREGSHPRSPKNIEAHHRVLGSKCGAEFAEGMVHYYTKLD